MKVINPVVSAGYAPYARAGTATYVNESGVMSTAAADQVRFDWTGGAFRGALVEPAATNLLLNSTTLSTQTVNVSAGQTYTLSFFGVGFVTLSGAATGLLSGDTVGGVVGIGRRVSRTFVAASSSLTISVFASITYAQLELGAVSTSWIPTTSAAASRSACVVTGYGLFASSFTDSTALYNAGTTYALNDVVRVAPRLYKSLQAANTGHTPASSPTWWVDAGPDNAYSMLDQQVSTKTIGATGTEQFAIRLPGNVDAVAVLNTVSTAIMAAVSDGYSHFSQQSLAGSLTTAIFGSFTPGNVVSAQLRNAGLLANAGEVIVGTMNAVGDTQYGLGVSMIDYSKKTTDDFGVTTFVPRGFSKRISANVVVKKTAFNTTLNWLLALRATPAVWIVSDDTALSAANVYGFLRDLKSVIDYPTQSLYSIEIEGLL